MSPFFVPFKNVFNAIQWCCLHITSKRSKMSLTNMMILTVRANKESESGSVQYQKSYIVQCSQLVCSPNGNQNWYPNPAMLISHHSYLIGGSLRVTLMGAFGFLPQSFGRWQGPTNHSIVILWMQGWDTMRWWGHSNPTICQRIYLNSKAVQKLWAQIFTA